VSGVPKVKMAPLPAGVVVVASWVARWWWGESEAKNIFQLGRYLGVRGVSRTGGVFLPLSR